MTHLPHVWGPVSWLADPITPVQHKQAVSDHSRNLGFDSVDDFMHFEQQGNLAADGDDGAARNVRYAERALSYSRQQKRRRDQTQEIASQR